VVDPYEVRDREQLMDKLESLLALMKLRGVGAARLRRVLTALTKAHVSVEDAFRDEGRRVLAEVGVAASSPSPDAGPVADRLRDRGIQCLVAPLEEVELPDFSRASLPPVLFVLGPSDLAHAPGIGFSGSRSASQRGLDVAADISEQVVRRGFNVISGGAKGVDLVAHRTALAQGGTTTVVLAEGILQYRMRQELREVFDPQRTIIVSEFFPDDRWLAGRAMQRNRTICSLSRALVLIEARSKGGTFAAGEAALDLGVPLFTADYTAHHEGNDGNQILLERGAHRLLQSRTTGRANLTRLMQIAANERVSDDADASRAAEQQEMWNR
jgi:DNA protecting protein DprA